MQDRSRSSWSSLMSTRPERKPLEPALPVEVVRELAVVDDGDVGERVGPVRVCAGDVDVGLGRHADVADRVRAGEALEVVLLGDLLGVAEVLDDLQRVAEREHLGVPDVLDPVGELLQVPVGEREGDAVGVLRLLLDVVDVGAERPQAPDDLVLVPVEAVGELEVAGRVRIGELVAHDQLVVVRPVERVPRRVGAAVLHGLEHPGHVAPDLMGAVPVDDPCNSAHFGLAF
jgi:hypothetical protein